MKNIFVDTNILIDLLADRTPFSEDAAQILNYALEKKIAVYVSGISFNNIYYILKQSCNHNESIKILKNLQAWTTIINVTKEIIIKSFDSNFKDFEDAIQFYSAKTLKKIDCIVTRNAKDFKHSDLPILSAKEALMLITSKI